MAFDLFKKKEKESKKGKPRVKPPVLKEEKKEEAPSEKPKAAKSKFSLESLILVCPHITEKSHLLSQQNQYVFEVFPRANKTEIKKAIEQIYQVKVLNVRIINVPSKKRRMGRTQGWKKGYKKAIVEIKEGQKIEVASA